MTLTKQEVERMVRLVWLTRDCEIDCEQCLTMVAEFAEQQLTSKTIPDGLKVVAHHLSICDECREEFEALLTTLGDMEGDADG